MQEDFIDDAVILTYNKTISISEYNILYGLNSFNFGILSFWIMNLNVLIFTIYYYRQIKKSSFLWNKVYYNFITHLTFKNYVIDYIKLTIIQEAIVKIYFKKYIESFIPINTFLINDITSLVFASFSIIFFINHKNNKIIAMNFFQNLILASYSYGLTDIQSLLLNIYSKMLFVFLLYLILRKL